MILLSEAVEIDTTPEALFDFTRNLERNFRNMSEKHISFRNIKGNPVTEGSVFCKEEWMGEKRLSRKYVVKRIIPNRFIEWEALFPASVIGDKVMMFITPRPDYVEFKELILLGKDSKMIGKALDWSISHMLEPHFDELKSRQTETLGYMKAFMERQSDPLYDAIEQIIRDQQQNEPVLSS